MNAVVDRLHAASDRLWPNKVGVRVSQLVVSAAGGQVAVSFEPVLEIHLEKVK